MCSIGLHALNLEPEQTKSLVAMSVSVCAFPKGGNEIFIFTFLGRLGSKYRFKIWFNL